MLSPGNVSLLLIILGPIAWRKYSSWQGSKTDSESGVIEKQAFFSIPDQLWLPSNLLLSISFLVLVYMHLSKLIDPSRALSRSDIFLLANTAVNSSVAQLRSRIASMSFKELGWKTEWGEEGLETIIRRLSSFEGRKLHLMIGTSPFILCNYCSNTNDYLIFSLSKHLIQYASNLILFGILTLRFDSLEVIDEIVFSNVEMLCDRDFRPKASKSQSLHSSLRRDGYSYRIPMLYLMGVFILAQAAIYFGVQDVPFGTGRWDHWHANYQLAYHTVFLTLTLCTFLCQRTPKIPAMIEIASLIKQSRHFSNMTLANVQAIHLTNQVLWTDAGLREKVIDWHTHRGYAAERALSDKVIDNLVNQAAKIGVNTSQMRKDSRFTAEEIWSNAEDSANLWLEAMQPTSQTFEPISPLTPS